jgi:parallel beta-helix repeat protein
MPLARRSLVLDVLNVLILIAPVALAISACGASTPTGPAPTPTAVAVTGTTSLPAGGQTAQLTAVASLSNGTTQNVTATAAWQSSNTAAATVSNAGLLTSVAAGSTTITATYQGKAGTLAVSVTAATGAFTLTSCQTIGAPGRYVQASDIRTAEATCIVVTANNVDLECNGHLLASANATVTVSNVQGFTMNNCNVTSSGFGDVVLTNTANATISNSQMTTTGQGATAITFDNSRNINVSNCVVNGFGNPTAAAITLITTQFAQILNNQLTNSGSSTPSSGGRNGGDGQCCVIVAISGNHNTFSQNQINGTWNGTTTMPLGQQGTDDGILLENEDSDLLTNNTISNNFDTGIEAIGPLTNTMIANNTITAAGMAGIGSWWATSWSGNTTNANRVSQSQTFAAFLYYGAQPAGEYPIPPPAAIGFQNNTFSGNVFQNSTATALPSMVVDFSGALPLPLNAGNNLIKDNSFPLNTPGPHLVPGSAFIDGGGNICNPNNGGNLVSCGTNFTGGSVHLRVPVPPSVKPLLLPPLVGPVKPGQAKGAPRGNVR